MGMLSTGVLEADRYVHGVSYIPVSCEPVPANTLIPKSRARRRHVPDVRRGIVPLLRLLQQPPAANSSGRRPGSPACWVILDTAAYIADNKNGTRAETTTRTGQVLGVSFWLADPPAVSHLCVHCPGMSVTDFLDEPLVVCSGKDVAVIRVAYAFGARPIYRAGHATNPSLELLPNPNPSSSASCPPPMARTSCWLFFNLDGPRCSMISTSSHPGRTSGQPIPLYFRSCAEEAIRNLNRVQIGRKGLSLSWSSSKLNRATQAEDK
ncbi:uncharacterized protein LOC112873371 [Panicum hallii]|uniref:uncharacterized protein LOC112873371 n=1 Tax=Panicum hallii TaxID=206008 RepID=UPI000DF4E261|nr:uncharacterized protein LOC112873371 [Panicum hallii]